MSKKFPPPEIEVLSYNDASEKKELSTEDMSMQEALCWEHVLDTQNIIGVQIIHSNSFSVV